MFSRKPVVFIFLLITVFSQCQCTKNQEAVRTFAAQYKAVQDAYHKRVKLAANETEKKEILKEKEKDLKKILKEYEQIPYTDAGELLKAKLLMEISKFQEALQTVAVLIEKKSPLIVEAKMVKAHLLIRTGKRAKALELFQNIEPLLKNESDRIMGWFYILLYSEDKEQIELYSKKFLTLESIPGDLTDSRAEIYCRLASLARERKDFAQAKEMLESAESVTNNKELKLVLGAALKQLDFIGRPAPEIQVDRWINSSPLSWQSLKGKATVLIFWAPWSNPCQDMLTALEGYYAKYKDNGLLVIGYTKLYGYYRDGSKKKEFNKEEEIEALIKFIRRKEITFPIALSQEGYGFERYKVIGLPTLIFIDTNGKVEDITLGDRHSYRIDKKIKKLLEENNGKNKD